MGVNATEIKDCLQKSLKLCYRSAIEHPFIVSMCLFSLFLYRFLPWLFFFLLSSSPVIICTIVLLGTLLSFGNPYIPEIEEEDEKLRKPQSEISSLRSGVLRDELIVEKDESFRVENYGGKSRDVEVKELKDLKEKDLSFKGKIEDDDDDDDDDEEEEGSGSDSVSESSDEGEKVEKEKVVIGGFDEGKPLIRGENDVGVKYSFLREKDVEGEGEEVENFESVHYSSISKGSDHDNDNGESSDFDSDSDRAESSSPDASMADIMPMLDELHPLLDSEVSQPALVSVDDDDDDDDDVVVSEDSVSSTDESEESEEEEAENAEVKDEEGKEEEEKQRGHDDGTEAVVTWTKEDEKNLMDLGNSELERNRRLESLIARRRARNSFRMTMTEKNLIDFEGMDPPFSMVPISTARKNPFDLHYDSNEGIEFPPIPGSAPSVLAPRRNPFDIPYDPLEEKPNLQGGSFEEEIFSTFEKDTHFRRYESFNVGPSSLGESMQDKSSRKLRPYFVPEPLDSEGIGYSTFQRQMSEISESKMSSVTEAESVSSVSDQDNHKNITEEESFHSVSHVEREVSTSMSHVEHELNHIEVESSSSEEVDMSKVEGDQEYHRGGIAGEVEGELSQPIPQAEQELLHPILHLQDAHDHVEVESSTSEENDVAETDQEYQREAIVDEENATESTSVEMQSIPSPEGSDTADAAPDVVEEKHTELSSSASSEVNASEELESSEQKRDDNILNNSEEASIEGSSLRSELIEAEDIQAKEPLYDWNWNPSEVEKTLSGISIIEEALNYVDRRVLTSTSSAVSDMAEESSEVGSIPVHLERSISYMDERPLQHNAVGVNNLSSTEVTETNDHDVIEAAISEDIQNVSNLTAPMTPLVTEQVVCGSGSSSSETEFEDGSSLSKEENEHQQVHITTTGLNPGHIDVSQFNVDEADPKVTGESSEGSTHIMSEVPPPLLEEMMAHSSSGGDHESSQEPSSPAVAISIDISKANDDSSELVHGDSGAESSSNTVMDCPPALVRSEISENDLNDEIHRSLHFEDLEHANVSRRETGVDLSDKELDEVDGITEIDEGFLAELDGVGDFAVEEVSLTGLHVVDGELSQDVESHSHSSHDSREALTDTHEHDFPEQNESVDESEVLSPKLESAIEVTLDSEELMVESAGEEKSKDEKTGETSSSSKIDESKTATELEATGDVSVESLETSINQTENITKHVQSLTGLQIVEDTSSKNDQDPEARSEDELHLSSPQFSNSREILGEVVHSDINLPSETNESEEAMNEVSFTGIQVLEDNVSEHNTHKIETEDLHSEISTGAVDSAVDVTSHPEITESEKDAVEPSPTEVHVHEDNVPKDVENTSQKPGELQELGTEVHVTERELPVAEDQLKPTESLDTPAEILSKVAKVHPIGIPAEESETVSTAEETAEASSSSTTVVEKEETI